MLPVCLNFTFKILLTSFPMSHSITKITFIYKITYPYLEEAMLDGHFIAYEISYKHSLHKLFCRIAKLYQTECQCDGINLVDTI